MTLNFDEYVRDGEQFINEVARETGAPDDKIRGARMLRLVLHVFRDSVTPAVSLQLIEWLPMLIKAVYVDGWKIRDDDRRLQHLDEFVEAVRAASGRGVVHDFDTDAEVESAIRAVFRVVRRHIPEAERGDLLAALPADWRPLLAETK